MNDGKSKILAIIGKILGVIIIIIAAFCAISLVAPFAIALIGTGVVVGLVWLIIKIVKR